MGLLLSGCGRTPSQTTEPMPVVTHSNAVATVNRAVISQRDLEERLRRSSRNETPETALEQLIATEAIYQKALIAGVDRQPEVQARIRNLIVAQFREQQLGLTKPAPVTDAEVQAAYDAQKDRFHVPEAAKGAVIFLETPRFATAEKRAEARQRADLVLVEARAAADERAFAQVVARHSEDRATRYRGGDTGWLEGDGGGYDPALAEALLKLSKPGDFAPLVEVERGFYIAKLLEKRAAAQKPMSAVQEALRYQLARLKAEQAEREFVASMKSGLDIQINRALLEAISAPVPSGEPPPLPEATTASFP